MANYMATKPEASTGIDPLSPFAPCVPLLDGKPCGPGFVNEQGALEYAEQQAMRAYVKQLEAAREEMRAVLRDCVQCLLRLPDREGAFRVTCIQQAEKALK